MKKITWKPLKLIICDALDEVSRCKSKKIIKIFIIGAASFLNANWLYAASDNPIDWLGNNFVFWVQKLGIYVAISMCIFEIVKSMLEGDPKRIPGVIAKYAIGVIGIWAIPSVFSGIGGAFN